MSSEITDITDITDSGTQFEARIDGRLAGFASYERTDTVVTYPHTLVLPEFEGKGVGSALAVAALDDARRRALGVRATCPFIAAWIERHSDYADLLVD